MENCFQENDGSFKRPCKYCLISNAHAIQHRCLDLEDKLVSFIKKGG
ncbi:hypothetical protein HMPREF3038_02483 [Akkermansia sp. KLE1797]|nr:hypothetical protein HMPREF3038_02483 [Akkermansia sp. KLE1797]KXU54783.1 hypothetical protein HMPREF3039_00930 [Akkermansia sp. KLE1798]KZA06172.1 hypothetical protein HMPREF1326_00020 [Akkermansia sp. KLE1605]